MEKIKLELKDKPLEPLIRKRPLAITPKRIILGLFIVFLISVVWYFWHEVCFLIKAPELKIVQPPTDITVNEDKFEIIGIASPFAYLTIRDQKIYIDKEGNFKAEIELVSGLNTIKIEAKNRFGKTNSIIRRIIFEQ